MEQLPVAPSGLECGVKNIFPVMHSNNMTSMPPDCSLELAMGIVLAFISNPAEWP